MSVYEELYTTFIKDVRFVPKLPRPPPVVLASKPLVSSLQAYVAIQPCAYQYH
jgi:hypothetical protein